MVSLIYLLHTRSISKPLVMGTKLTAGVRATVTWVPWRESGCRRLREDGKEEGGSACSFGLATCKYGGLQNGLW